LRENRATNPEVTEVTVLSGAAAAANGGGLKPQTSPPAEGHNFPKVDVPLIGYKSKRQMLVVAAIIAAMLLTGAGLMVRSRNAASQVPNAITGPSPAATPAATIEPTPSPSPSPTPKRDAKKPTKPVEKKGRSIGSKIKSGLKKLNPF
jgi:hypothetical protein